MPKAKPSAMMELWSINRWLRWTGFRLAIEVDIQGADSPTREPTRIGLVWWGWKDLFPKPKVSLGHFLAWDPLKPDPACCNICHDPRLSCQQASDAYVFDPMAPGEDIQIPYRKLGRGHCGHAPKCINSDEHRDERDPLGCCNCGTRKTEQAALLDSFKLNLDALQAALPPVDDQAEARLERLLVEQRKRDAKKVRSYSSRGPADHPSLHPASEHCQHPIKGEFGTWCKGCTACGTVSDDTDSW